jgi:hypothetical protein
VTTIDFGRARLRSNPRLRLVPFDLLPAHGQAFEGLGEDADCFGVLVPPEGSAVPLKSVSREAALLFMALREPACLPRLLASLFGIDPGERLQALILDGVFEVEQSGSFLSGPAAAGLFGDPQDSTARSRLGRLCDKAIAYAAALPGLTAHEVAMRLYLFNAVPPTPALHRRFDNDDRLLAFLLQGSDVAARLQSRWQRETPGEGWLMWRSATPPEATLYKLYVSPTLEHLPRVFASAVAAFSTVRCTRFKVGRGVYGVSRPDKLVAYFSSLDGLQRAAELIGESAAASTAQGVPFTAPIDPEGLLSWGMDPPRFEQVPAWQRYQSWRQWLTGRIAVYVLAAGEAGADAHSFVRRRLELDGVDPLTWNPDLAIWREPVGAELEAA